MALPNLNKADAACRFHSMTNGTLAQIQLTLKPWDFDSYMPAAEPHLSNNRNLTNTDDNDWQGFARLFA